MTESTVSTRDKSTKPLRVVAIDGPAGSGKSTVARQLAQMTGLEYLDTGAMYRAATAAVLRSDVDPEDGNAVVDVVRSAEISFGPDGVVLLNGSDVTAEIRSEPVSFAVSAVSAIAEVRKELVAQQRQWAQKRGGGVLDGRDIATAVFPDALLKVFLIADAEVRAARRAGESKGSTYDRILQDILRRDKLDSGRKQDPLRQDPNAHLVDTSDLTVDEVVETLKNLLDEAEG